MQITVTWSWPETAGDSYLLYYGTASGVYGAPLPAHNGMTVMTDVPAYFALTATRNGIESDFSPESSYP